MQHVFLPRKHSITFRVACVIFSQIYVSQVTPPTSLHCNTPMSIQSILFACTHKHTQAQRPQIKSFLPLATSRKDSAQEPHKQWIQPWSAYRGLGHTHLPTQTFRSKMHLGYYTCVHVYCRELQTVLTGSTVMAFLSSVQHIQECTYIWHLLFSVGIESSWSQSHINTHTVY